LAWRVGEHPPEGAVALAKRGGDACLTAH
jgi:hypothetical protein